MANQPVNFNLRSLLDQHKLVGPNFLAWRRNLRIVLQAERIEYTLDQAPPEPPAENATQAARNTYARNRDPFNQAYCVIMGSLSDDLQKQCENN